MKKIYLLIIAVILIVGCVRKPIVEKIKPIALKNEKISTTIDLKKYITGQKLKELVDSPNEKIWIIDVRTKSEFDSGHIPTAKHFPRSEILNRINELPKDKYLILYCYSGARSRAAVEILFKHGYDRRKLLNWGGIMDWRFEQVSGE